MKQGKPLKRRVGLKRTVALKASRTPLKATTPLEVTRKRLKPVSDRRRAQTDDYEQFKAAVWDRDGGCCQAGPNRGKARGGWPEVVCGGRIDPHHVWPTGRYPKRRCDPDAALCLCRNHHDAVHLYDPRRARQLGLLI